MYVFIMLLSRQNPHHSGGLGVLPLPNGPKWPNPGDFLVFFGQKSAFLAKEMVKKVIFSKKYDFGRNIFENSNFSRPLSRTFRFFLPPILNFGL